MTKVDPDCAALALAFRRRATRRGPEDRAFARDPMFRKTGASFDLKSIREYAPTDDPRRIDWRLFGRTDRPYIREYYEEDADAACVLFDRSASMPYADPGAARTIALSLAWLLSALGTAVSLASFGTSLDRAVRYMRRIADANAVAAWLDSLEFSGGSDIASSLSDARTRLRVRRAIIVSDFLDADFDPAKLPFPRAFLVRLDCPFDSPGVAGGDWIIDDPEDGSSVSVPWDEEAAAEYDLREREFFARFERIAAAKPSQLRFFSIQRGEHRSRFYRDFLDGFYA